MHMNMVYLYELKGNHITIEYCSQGRHYDIFLITQKVLDGQFQHFDGKYFSWSFTQHLI